MLSEKIFEVLQHNPDQDCPQVLKCLSGSKYKSSLQIHQQRRQKICRSVPTRNIQKHSADLVKLFQQVNISFFYTFDLTYFVTRAIASAEARYLIDV